MELSVSPTVSICVLDSEGMLASVELQNKGFSLSSTCTRVFSETLVSLGLEMPEQQHYPGFTPPVSSLQCIQWACCAHSIEEKS